jgi:hypothetical protein
MSSVGKVGLVLLATKKLVNSTVITMENVSTALVLVKMDSKGNSVK